MPWKTGAMLVRIHQPDCVSLYFNRGEVMEENIYIDVADYIAKYDALYYFLIGMRGVGKTYSFKRYAINLFKHTGKQFVYLRRFSSELSKKLLQNFFTDISQEFPEDNFEIKDSTAYINGEQAGFFLPISKGVLYKGVSAFDNVGIICFDEFLLYKSMHHYLPREVEMFEDLNESISRMREVKVIFLSNYSTGVNPYFLFYGIRFTPNSPRLYKTNDIVAINFDRPVYIDAKYNTRRGRILKGSLYAKSAIENKAREDDVSNIMPKPRGSYILCTISVDGNTIAIWKAPSFMQYFISKDTKDAKIHYTNDPKTATPEVTMISYNSYIMKKVINSYELGLVMYESQYCKNIFNSLLGN